MINPEYVDASGRIYFNNSRGMGDGPQDSTQVSRFDRSTEETETMGWTWRPEPIVTRSGDNVRMMSIQMSARDDWAAGPDGRFAIVRADGYVVEWYFPDGRVVTGPPNPVETRGISEEDKYAYLDQRSSAGLMMSISMSSEGGTEMAMSRGGGGGGRSEPNLDDYTWAEEFPPFRPDRSQVAPTGGLWVERWLPADVTPEMDVFGEDGHKIGSVSLPEGRELIGWGHTADGGNAVYLVRTDEYDLKWLERYRVIR
jgi:hypothetical protein